MDQTVTTEERVRATLDGWMSVEELAEERWERAPGWRAPRVAPAGIAEDGLPF